MAIIKKFNGFEAKYQAVGEGYEPLPVGAYVAKILQVKSEEKSDGRQMIIMCVDVAEGEHKDFFNKRFTADKQNNIQPLKWKGVYRLNVPIDNDDAWKTRNFCSAIGAIEDSNNGYRWNWDDQTLVGKFVGINVREREWEWENKSGVTTEIGALVPAQDVRDGKVTPMKIKKIQKKDETATTTTTSTITDELPF